jgi:hypothetical protein
MAARFNGQASIKLTTRGTLDARGKGLGYAIKNQVTDMVNQALKENGIEPIEKGQIKKPKTDEQTKLTKAGKWMASQMGKAMVISQSVSSGIRYKNALASGDEAKASKTLVNGGISAITLALGASKSPWGLVASTLISAFRGIFGNYIDNQIQEKYDTRRLSYRLTNYDLSKYSTQTYNYNQQKWIATDTQRIERNILKNTKIS